MAFRSLVRFHKTYIRTSELLNWVIFFLTQLYSNAGLREACSVPVFTAGSLLAGRLLAVLKSSGLQPGEDSGPQDCVPSN